jgi:hypothetical protein
VRRWLLQGLEHGIGGVFGEHMDFVNDVHLISSAVGGIVDPLAQFPDVIDATVAGSIDLYHIQCPAPIHSFTHLTGVTRLPLTVGKAVDGLGQDTPGAGFACTSRATEEISMSYPPGLQGVAQGLGDMLLPYHLS